MTQQSIANFPLRLQAVTQTLSRLAPWISAAVLGSGMAGAAAQPVGALVNGAEVARGEYPFFASLEMHGSCGGALVAPLWIVTAAQCLDNLRLGDAIDVNVGRAGDLLEKGRGHFRQGVRAVRAPNNIDIALIQLNQPVEDIVPLALSVGSIEPGAKVRTVATGDGSPSQQASTAEFRIERVNSTQFVARSSPEFAAACYGDAGSPVFAETADGPRLVAVMQSIGGTGLKCVASNDAYLARTDVLRQWFHDTLAASVSGRIEAARTPSGTTAIRNHITVSSTQPGDQVSYSVLFQPSAGNSCAGLEWDWRAGGMNVQSQILVDHGDYSYDTEAVDIVPGTCYTYRTALMRDGKPIASNTPGAPSETYLALTRSEH